MRILSVLTVVAWCLPGTPVAQAQVLNEPFPPERVGDFLGVLEGSRDFGRNGASGAFRRGDTVYFFADREVPGSFRGSAGGQRVWAIGPDTDLANIPELRRYDHDTLDGSNAHGWQKHGSTVFFGPRLTIDRDAEDWDVFAVRDFSVLPQAGCEGRGGSYADWHMTFHWAYNGIAPRRLELRERHGRELMCEGFVHYSFDRDEVLAIGHPIFFGNILFMVSDQRDMGVAAWDLSDPRQPILLDYLQGSTGIGSYWADLHGQTLVLPRRKTSRLATEADQTGTVFLVDVSDPTDLRFAELPVHGRPKYATLQYPYSFVQNSKIDLRTGEVVLELDELSAGVDTSEMSYPIGNILITGSHWGENFQNEWRGQGHGVWIHSAEPDTAPPTILASMPYDGHPAYPPRSLFSFCLSEDIETENIRLGENFILRPLDGEPIGGNWLFNSGLQLSFNPDRDLAPGSYEVVFEAGAFTDLVGNPNERFEMRFEVDTGRDPRPVIERFELDRELPLSGGEALGFVISARDDDALEYRVRFGDGTDSAWFEGGNDISATLRHAYEPGLYLALLQVRERSTRVRLSAAPLRVVVSEPPPVIPPRRSGQLALDEGRRRLWVVNPDNHSVAIVDPDELTSRELPLDRDRDCPCLRPTSVSLDENGRAWISCRDSDTIVVLDPSGRRAAHLALDHGARPVSLVFPARGAVGFVALEGTNRLRRLDAKRLTIGPPLAEPNGVNFELYRRQAEDDLFPVDRVSALSPEAFAWRFTGTWEGPLDTTIRETLDHPRIFWRDTAALVPPASFAVVFRGLLEVCEAGRHEFELSIGHNDGARLTVDGRPLIDIDQHTPNDTLEQRATIDLARPGRYPLELRFVDWNNFQVLRLRHRAPGEDSFTVLSPDRLYPEQELRKPGSLALSSSGKKLYVAQSVSDSNAGKIAVLDTDTGERRATIRLAIDEKSIDDGARHRGVPGYLSLALEPGEERLWFAGTKMNTLAGPQRDGNLLSFETTLRSVLGPIDLATLAEPSANLLQSELFQGARIHDDNRVRPSSIRIDPTGTRLFVTNEAARELKTFDLRTGRELDRQTTGLAPQDVLIDPATRRVFVKNFLGRSLSVFEDDLASELRPAEVATLPTVFGEELSDRVLLGKQLFYSSKKLDDPDLNPSPLARDGYFSCAACHLDGGHDGQVWDFTQRGEGFRNTTSLRGRRGTGHGPVHWTANFDEIQDFELDIRAHFAGTGLIEGAAHRALGEPNAGRSTELDALAAYVSSLGAASYPRSPYRHPDGSFTSAARRGALVFRELGCGSCHDPLREFTNSHGGQTEADLESNDVGTVKATTGRRAGRRLPGLDTPTLLGIHATAPYLHDGSAPTIRAALEQHALPELTRPELDDLVRYLLELDRPKPSIFPGARIRRLNGLAPPPGVRLEYR